MYCIANSDIDAIRRLLEAYADFADGGGKRPRDTRNLARKSRVMLKKLAKKSPLKEDNYRITVKVTAGGVDVTEFVQAVRTLPDGTYGVELTRLRNPRTSLQNRYLWAVVYPNVLQGLQDAGWDDFTGVEEVHEYMKARFGSTKAVNKHTGETVEFPSSTAKMDTGQMSAYIDKVRDFAAEYLNTYIPEPK